MRKRGARARPKDTAIRLDRRALVLAVAEFVPLYFLMCKDLFIKGLGENWAVVRFLGGFGCVGAKQKGTRCIDGVARGS